MVPLLHRADKQRVVLQKSHKVFIRRLDALHVLVVEMRLYEGLVVPGVADGGLVDGQDLSLEGKTL